MTMRLFPAFSGLLLALISPASALEAIKVSDRVWALVGDLGQRSALNLGNNATFGVVVTDAGVVLVDAGGSANGAAEIDAEITRLTDKPVLAVINTGGQDHRWLGNSYWKAKGARLISSKAAVADQGARFDMQWEMLRQLIGVQALNGTEPAYADETFERDLDIVIGGTRFRLRHPGRAHTPGDLIVWLPDSRIAFAGDIVFAERMLGLLPLPISSSRDWIEAFDELAALDPAMVVPGHGRPVTLAQARADTRDYLVHLRTSVRSVLDRNGNMLAAGRIDQSAFMRLTGADQLAGRNAQTVFAELEFE
ncbi:MAG: MBL fold metallo-hydrolase [Alphaproteobacteria bacterium]|nr:MAG: MBL fold metallo-hydrolase [Alphaproteobacteria bacterium]